MDMQEQGKGNSLDEQLALLFAAGCDTVIEEKYTAKNNDRPKLKELLEKLKEGDTFTVTKLDRFARSTIEGSKLVQDLIEKNIKVHILNIGVMDNTPTSKLIRHIFLAFAEFERDMIIERTSEGKAIARTKESFKDGRPKKYTNKQISHALGLLAVNGGNCSYKEVEEITGISISTLKRENKSKNIVNI